MIRSIGNVWIKAFLDLLFPSYCPVCRIRQIREKEPICMLCLSDISLTGFSAWKDNPMELEIKVLAGFEQMTALFYFNRFGASKKLIHQFKYRGEEQIGKYLGKWLASEISLADRMDAFDLIVPVPMHPVKQKKRGFNQALIIAISLSEILKIPCDASFLTKSRHTASQTKSGRFYRIRKEPIDFECDFRPDYLGKHLLLVDDIVTSGGTAAACFHAIKKHNACKISLASLGYTE